MAGREKRRRVNPNADAIWHIKNKTDKLDSLEELLINAEKGRGVFAKKPFNQGDFILEYRGDLISDSEAQRRREVYTPTQRVFMFDLAGKSLCVDGAKEDGSLGRLVNDDHLNPNSRMRLVEVDRKSHICLFAIRPINISEEISYNYGGKDWPWRKKPAEPTTLPDSVDTPPAAVEGVSSCPEPCGTKPAEPTILPDSVDTPPAAVEGVSSCPEPCGTKSVDNNAAEQTQTKRKTSGQHRQRTIKKKQKTKSVDNNTAEQTQTKRKTSGQHRQRTIKKKQKTGSTELRKQIATLSSVLNLKDADRDQLARYLGHNIRIHDDFYRLKLDTLQIAKVSKVLLAMQQGRIGDYIGMNLDEIDISPDESVPTLTPDKEDVQGEDEMGEGEDSETEVMSETRPSNTLPPESPSQMEVSSSGISSSIKETRPSNTLPPKSPSGTEVSSSGISSSLKGRRPTMKKPWTTEETSAVERSMSRKFIEKFVVPGKEDCIACINANPEALKERDWRAVKFHVKNKITALKRKAFSH